MTSIPSPVAYAQILRGESPDEARDPAAGGTDD